MCGACELRRKDPSYGVIILPPELVERLGKLPVVHAIDLWAEGDRNRSVFVD